MVKIPDIGEADSRIQPESPETVLNNIWEWLENVSDPEVPVLSVLDLGVVRSVSLRFGEYEFTSYFNTDNIIRNSTPGGPETPEQTRKASFVIQITPTYTGCPAMNMIAANIRMELASHGLEDISVVEVLSPAWTTDWLRESGRQKLRDYGIAPPQTKARIEKMLFSDTSVPCPLCGSDNTERISEFGSTACKSLHRCLDCREPFDYFKCH